MVYLPPRYGPASSCCSRCAICSRAARVSRAFSYNSGLDRRLQLGRRTREGTFERSPDVDVVKGIIRERGIKLFIADPMVEFHGVPENDNELIGRVGGVFREIASDCDCAVMFFHHTPKSSRGSNAAGDANSLRGGGVLVGQARFVFTMYPMDVEEGSQYEIEAAHVHAYVRLDAAKSNMTARDSRPIWWKKIGVDLKNGDAFNDGDSVGVLRHEELVEPDRREEEGLRRSAQVREIAAEVVATCQRGGHADEASAISMTQLVERMDRRGVGLNTMRGDVGRLISDHTFSGQHIVRRFMQGGGRQGRDFFYVVEQ